MAEPPGCAQIALEAAKPGVVDIDNPAQSDLTPEPAGIVTTQVVVPSAIVVAPAHAVAATVAISTVLDRDAAVDIVSATDPFDPADVGYFSTPPAIAGGVALGDGNTG